MPTGYTNCIKDGVTFEQFVWKCARAMGALVMMRDEPSNAPIPVKFEPSNYYAEEVAKAKAKLLHWFNISRNEARHNIEYFSNEEKEEIARTEALNRWLAQLRASVPPTGSLGSGE